MIDMNDWLKSWDAYYTPAQTLSDGDVAWASSAGIRQAKAAITPYSIKPAGSPASWSSQA